MRIGIIDSGKGGLAVARRIQQEQDQLILILDQGFFPYGTKSKEFLIKRAYYLTDLLVRRGVELIILACNTLSVVAYPFLKNSFKIKIIGIFDYFVPYMTEKYTLIGSTTTIAYAKAKYPVQVIDGTEFIEAIEKKKNIDSFLDSLKQINTKGLLLGCTHFLSIKEASFPIPVHSQIQMIEEEIKRARKGSSS
ncbi:MAG: hypothetical protein K2N64_08305 [Anaeroplasmataceae bacterium]|nr:hypothetical protein [Anaeroplasmataceae bacterium]